MNDAEKQAAYAAKRAAGRGESKVRICAMASIRPDELVRFRLWNSDQPSITVQTTAEALMQRYPPGDGWWRWEIAE